ncbi:MAG: hypothetical protein V4560_18635 [Bacteroidota bacterium]
MEEKFNIFLDRLKSRGKPSVTGWRFTPEQYKKITETVKILNSDLEQWSVNLKNRVVNQISTHLTSA